MPTYSNPSRSTRAAKRPNNSENNLLPISNAGQEQLVPSPDGELQKKARKILMDKKQLSVLKNNLRIIGLYVNSRHLEMLTPPLGDSLYASSVCELDSAYCNRTGITVYQITKLMYNEDENTFEKLISVYSALNSFGGLIALILKSDGSSTKLYLATNTNGRSEIAGELLANNMHGQFPGCEINPLSETEKNVLLDSFGIEDNGSSNKTVRSLSMIPSRRDDERQHDKTFSTQGYEKFIDAMTGQKYTLVVLSQRVSPDAKEEYVEGLEALYTSLSPYAKEIASYGESDSDTINFSISSNISSSVSKSISKSFGTSHTNSVSHGRSYNDGRGYELFDIHFNSGSGRSFGTSFTNGSTSGKAVSDGSVEGVSAGENQGSSTTSGNNLSLTVNRDNKAVQDLLAKIEEHLKRINFSQTFGIWNSACYIITDDVATATIGTSTLASLFSGDSQAAPRAYYNQWDATNPTERKKVLEYIQNLRHPVIDLTMFQEITDENGNTKKSEYQNEHITPAMMINGKEIPTLMGLPRKSVPGIVVDSMAEFGRNIPELWKKDVKRPIFFGNVYHMRQLEKTPVCLDLDTFASHMFICGASGCGKSNTTYNLLQKLIENKVPFLVIEPAKGEYKIEYSVLPGINVFTVDETPYRILRINPFEFSPGIHIREHLDNVLQVISACWPLYGAMPGLLKQAFEQVYLDHGWDLEHSERIIAKGSKYPVVRNLVTALERIIGESPYSIQTKSDYKGALLNRVSSLCNGFEGQIFGRSIGISERTLFNENTIIDLSSIGSDETRSLIMGILIIKLKNYRKSVGTAPNSKLIHVTVLEEAHNLLKRCSHETNVEFGNVQGAAVGSLCRCIAEMRSAGEGFMIIDQSPGAVDEAAIKNTAIKIAMRLPSKKDCEEIGAALSLNDNQIRELSRLDTGVAAIFHAGWTDTLLAKMGNIWDKRYRSETAMIFDKGTYTRIQGAIVQMMYKNLVEGDFDNIYVDVRDLIKILCKGSNAIKPILSQPKQDELLESIRVFVEENDIYIKERKMNNIKSVFFEFVFNFLQLDSVMRIFTLPNLNGKFDLTSLTKKEIRKVIEWEENVRKGIVRYLYMPEKCEPTNSYKWPLSGTDSEYFVPIYVGILVKYARNYRYDERYNNAVAYLNSIKYFDDIGKGK